MIKFSEFRGHEKVTVEVSYIFTRTHTTCGQLMWLVICPELNFETGVLEICIDQNIDFEAANKLCHHLNERGIDGLPSAAMSRAEAEWALSKYRDAAKRGAVPTTDDWEWICENDIDLKAMIIKSEVSAYRQMSSASVHGLNWSTSARSCVLRATGLNMEASH